MPTELRPGIHPVPETEVPSGWRAVQLGQVSRTVAGGRLGLTKQTHYRSAGVPAYSAAGQDGYVDRAEYRSTSGVVLSAIGAHCGRTFLAEGDWTTLANTQAIIPSEGLDSRFLNYRTNLPGFWPRSGSAQPFIKPSSIGECWIMLPPLAEQRRIADIIDTIADAISGTERLIAKLSEARNGLLQDLLARGIGRSGELRDPSDSGVFRETPIGRIPATWEESQFSECILRSPQNGLYKPASHYSSRGTAIVRIDGFYDGVLAPVSSLKRLRLTSVESRDYALQRGDIIVNRVNSLDFVGKAAIIPELSEPVVFESNIMRCRLRPQRVTPEFMILWLTSPRSRQWFHKRAKSAIAQASVNQTDLKDLPVAIPPLDEQNRVVEYQMTADANIELERQQLNKLRTLRAGLIADMLSGRVRVGSREAAGA